MILSAQSIRERREMINPFAERTVEQGLTYGLGPAGYDIRVDRDVLLWPLGWANVDSVEWFDIPTDVKPNVQDKSTWARLGVRVGNTTMEPGWRGYLRIELTNHRWWFRRIRRGMPIAQVEFNLLDHPTNQPYKGLYQDQPKGQDAIFA